MIFLALPPMVVLIIPVIALEFWAARKSIRKESGTQKWLGLAGANIFSTFVGWPLAWTSLVIVQMSCGGSGAHGLDSPLGVILSVTLQAPWLVPYEEDMYWMAPVAAAFLLIPFFFVSVFVERGILRLIWKNEAWDDIKKFSWRGHIYSYAFLLVVVGVFAVISLAEKR